jgi:rSAM/selenodomain-associated transferase 1
MNEPVAVAVLAKAPLPGFAKTRLIPALGAEGAALLQARLIEHAVATACVARVGPITLWAAPDETHPLFHAIAARLGVALARQRGGDLGARLAGVFARLFARGFRAAVAIGSDAPTLPPRYLRDAVGILLGGEADVVLGPARDGGYYLIGLRSPAPRLFTGVPWSTGAVYESTIARARRANLSVASLPPWDDVDTIEDLGRLASALARRRGAVAPRTRRWLAGDGADRVAGGARR